MTAAPARCRRDSAKTTLKDVEKQKRFAPPASVPVSWTEYVPGAPTAGIGSDTENLTGPLSSGHWIHLHRR